MAQENEPEKESADEVKPEKKPGFIKRLLRRRWVAPTIVVLIMIQATVIGYMRLTTGVGDAVSSPEVTLGEFQFISSANQDEPISQAIFQVHVSLLSEAEHDGRLLLEARRHKIQQEIEQLLRQAHGQDFEDPLLTELKRQLQTMINEILAKQIVAEVIITDLSINRVADVGGDDADQSDRPGADFNANFEERQSG